jgi:hypothetical protein
MNNDQQQTSQLTASPTQLRLAYQQRASAFLFHHAASHPDTSWIGDAARSITLRAIYSRPFEKNINDLTNNTDSTISWRDYACMACGTPSYPLSPSTTPPTDAETPGKITLRTLRRGRTRRRRASRSRASQYHKEALFQKRIGTFGNANNLHLASAWEEKQRIQMASIHRLGDGRAGHCVVIRCSFCGNEKKRKGVEITRAGKKIKKKKTIASSTATNIATRDCAKSSEKTKNQDECIDSNFISLPILGNRAQKNKRKEDRVHHDTNTAVPPKNFSFKNKTTTITTTATATTSLLSGGKKKKVKKKPVSSKGLMDFLSSLND